MSEPTRMGPWPIGPRKIAIAKSDTAAVKAPVAFSTYVGGLTSLGAGVAALVTALIKAFNLPNKPSVAQAVVINGAFFLTAAAVIGFAWVVVADFRSRSMAQSASIGHMSPPHTDLAAGHGSPSHFKIKTKDQGVVYTVLGTRSEGKKAEFLVYYPGNDGGFKWLASDTVDFVAS